MTYRFVPPILYRVGQFGFLIEALIRGLCYFAAGGPSTQTQDVAALSAPIYVWGGLFALCSVVGLFGEVLIDRGRSDHRFWPAFLGHSGLLFLYLGMAVSAFFAVPAGGQSSFGVGFVSPFDFALLALWHWIFARRRKHV